MNQIKDTKDSTTTLAYNTVHYDDEMTRHIAMTLVIKVFISQFQKKTFYLYPVPDNREEKRKRDETRFI